MRINALKLLHVQKELIHSVAVERPLLGNNQIIDDKIGVPSVQEFAKRRAALTTVTSANAHNKKNKGGYICGCACYR